MNSLMRLATAVARWREARRTAAAGQHHLWRMAEERRVAEARLYRRHNRW